MFCLRSWIPILFFLTNASPIYLLLFITATYILNRPCVYCSLLLAILVLSLFDFHASWFPQSDLTTASTSNSTSGFSVLSTAVAHSSTLVAALNSTLETLFNATAEELKKRMPIVAAAGSSQVAPSAGWVREIVAKREWRVPCLDVLVRL